MHISHSMMGESRLTATQMNAQHYPNLRGPQCEMLSHVYRQPCKLAFKRLTHHSQLDLWNCKTYRLDRRLECFFCGDQLGLTHVLYHEIDTGDKGPVVSRPYRYDRVKQGIIDYHIEKMLQEGAIRPIQSSYASPVVLMRKNNCLPPDSPEAYRFAIDYRKFNAITKYPPISITGD
ncbi:retrovirus-related Pol polyprotein from transposon 17.6 [Trichonephila clavipes]|nr:retrovirus-related Pol polyprotein from transposon 17.6 [Trichonephila clavipes]